MEPKQDSYLDGEALQPVAILVERRKRAIEQRDAHLRCAKEARHNAEGHAQDASRMDVAIEELERAVERAARTRGAAGWSRPTDELFGSKPVAEEPSATPKEMLVVEIEETTTTRRRVTVPCGDRSFIRVTQTFAEDAALRGEGESSPAVVIGTQKKITRTWVTTPENL